MLDDCVCHSVVLQHLDTSRSASAEMTYQACREWFRAYGGRVRFPQSSIIVFCGRAGKNDNRNTFLHVLL